MALSYDPVSPSLKATPQVLKILGLGGNHPVELIIATFGQSYEEHHSQFELMLIWRFGPPEWS